jgi:peptidoglycan/xylan/chitin deacetylase (PgdA/CDA1 family)
VFGKSDHVVIVRLQPGQTAQDLAAQYLRDPNEAWRATPLTPPGNPGGQVLALALDPLDAGLAERAHFVPVLCYHRFTDGRSTGAMEVSAAAFEAQLQWLKDNHYVVEPLERVVEFVNQRRLLPPKTIALTIDDGYRSAYQVAFPLLRRFGDPATFFIYTDFIGGGQALTWAEMDELRASGLIDIQAHSKTHTAMAKRRPDETAAAYGKRIQAEVSTPLALLNQHFRDPPEVFAYPYGAVNVPVMNELRRYGYGAGATVSRGGNPDWAPPLLLRRDMIYGGDSLETFARRIQAAERGEDGEMARER